MPFVGWQALQDYWPSVGVTDDMVNVRPGINIAFNLLAIIAVSPAVFRRLYVRRYITKSLGYDDWLLLAAWSLFVLHVLMTIGQILVIWFLGGATHFFLLCDLTSAGAAFYLAALILTRLAILTFFLRALARADYTWQRWTMLISTGLICAFMFLYCFIAIFDCGNPFNWDSDVHCLDATVIDRLRLVCTVLTMVSDCVLVLIPAQIICTSMMSRNTKLQALGVIGLGLVATIVSAVRLPLLYLGEVKDPRGWADWMIYTLLGTWEIATAITFISLAALSQESIRQRTIGAANNSQARGKARKLFAWLGRSNNPERLELDHFLCNDSSRKDDFKDDFKEELSSNQTHESPFLNVYSVMTVETA